jgi:hypothetical protein
MVPLGRDQTVGSIAEYLTALPDTDPTHIRWYRGSANAAWSLIPSLARRGEPALAVEGKLLTRFRQSAHPMIPPDLRIDSDSDWDWMLLMQHYEIPTRLLDWTENALAALFFASLAAPDTEEETDGCVWLLDPVGLNRAGGLSRPDDIPALGNPLLRDFLPTAVASPTVMREPLAVLAERKFPRLVAQSGVFTVMHRHIQPLEEIDGGAYVSKIVIAVGSKTTIRKGLMSAGVTRLAMFPELQSVAEYVRTLIP